MFSFYQLSLPELKISFTSIYKGLVSSKNTKCKDILNLLNYHRGAFLVAQQVKNPPAVQETPGLIPGLGRSPGEGNGNPLQYSCLENPMSREA